MCSSDLWLGSSPRLLLPVRFGRVSKMLRRWGAFGGSRYTIVIHWQDCAEIAPKSCPASLADGSDPVKKLLLQRAAAQKPHDVFHGSVPNLQGPNGPGPGSGSSDSAKGKKNFSQSCPVTSNTSRVCVNKASFSGTRGHISEDGLNQTSGHRHGRSNPSTGLRSLGL